MQEKKTLKPFCVEIAGLSTTELLDLMVLVYRAGIPVNEVACEDGEEVFYPELRKAICYEPTNWKYLGVTNDLESGVYDYKECYDDNVMAYEDAVSMVKGIIDQENSEDLHEQSVSTQATRKSSKKKKQKPPVLKQRKVVLLYTNGKQYTLKGVGSVVMNDKSKTAYVNYKQTKGAVEIISNVHIPFAELNGLMLISHNSDNVMYSLREGEVVAMTVAFKEFHTTQH